MHPRCQSWPGALHSPARVGCEPRPLQTRPAVPAPMGASLIGAEFAPGLGAPVGTRVRRGLRSHPGCPRVSPGCTRALRGRSPAPVRAKRWVARDGIARAERAVPQGRAEGGDHTTNLFSDVEGFKNLFLSLFLESLRLGPKVPGRVALSPSASVSGFKRAAAARCRGPLLSLALRRFAGASAGCRLGRAVARWTWDSSPAPLGGRGMPGPGIAPAPSQLTWGCPTPPHPTPAQGHSTVPPSCFASISCV